MTKSDLIERIKSNVSLLSEQELKDTLGHMIYRLLVSGYSPKERLGFMEEGLYFLQVFDDILNKEDVDEIQTS